MQLLDYLWPVLRKNLRIDNIERVNGNASLFQRFEFDLPISGFLVLGRWLLPVGLNCVAVLLLV